MIAYRASFIFRLNAFLDLFESPFVLIKDSLICFVTAGKRNRTFGIAI